MTKNKFVRLAWQEDMGEWFAADNAESEDDELDQPRDDPYSLGRLNQMVGRMGPGTFTPEQQTEHTNVHKYKQKALSYLDRIFDVIKRLSITKLPKASAANRGYTISKREADEARINNIQYILNRFSVWIARFANTPAEKQKNMDVMELMSYDTKVLKIGMDIIDWITESVTVPAHSQILKRSASYASKSIADILEEYSEWQEKEIQLFSSGSPEPEKSDEEYMQMARDILQKIQAQQPPRRE